MLILGAEIANYTSTQPYFLLEKNKDKPSHESKTPYVLISKLSYEIASAVRSFIRGGFIRTLGKYVQNLVLEKERKNQYCYWFEFIFQDGFTEEGFMIDDEAKLCTTFKQSYESVYTYARALDPFIR